MSKAIGYDQKSGPFKPAELHQLFFKSSIAKHAFVRIGISVYHLLLFRLKLMTLVKQNMTKLRFDSAENSSLSHRIFDSRL